MIRTTMALALGGCLWMTSAGAEIPSSGFPDMFPQLEQAMPERERAFIDIIHEARKAFAAARLSAAKKDIRVGLQLRISEFWKKDPNFSDWVGVVRTSATTREGDARIEVALTPQIAIRTAKNRDQDPDRLSLVAPDSPLFPVVGELSPDQPVKFSARLLRYVVGSDQEMVEQPQILVHFQSLKPLAK